MATPNPIIRAIKNSRATIGEKMEAQEYLEELLPHDIGDVLGNKPAPLISLPETIDAANKLRVTGDEIVGLSTSYQAIDKLTRGIGPSEIVVIFGDTSHGKSQLAQNITLNLAARNNPVLFVGLEMNNTENTVRFIEMLGDEEKAKTLPIIYPASMDLGYKDIDNLMAAGKKEGVVLMAIDHLHMFARDATNLPNEISLICHELKRVARKYEIPMLVISHINRGGTGRGVPELRDLKGSGSIEQDADIALAVWRDMNLPDADQTLKVVLRKNRLRGRKHTHAELAIFDNARLGESLTLEPFSQT